MRLRFIGLLVTLVVVGPLSQGATKTNTQRYAQPSPAPQAKLRQPDVVGGRLSEICLSAGYGPKELQRCAQSMSDLCTARRIDPRTPRCWQWVVDQDVDGRFDRQALGRGRGVR